MHSASQDDFELVLALAGVIGEKKQQVDRCARVMLSQDCSASEAIQIQ